MSIIDDKRALRREMRAKRRIFVDRLDITAGRFAFRALPSPVVKLLEGRSVAALYAPMGREVPALRLADALRRLGLSVALPIVSQEEGVMDFHLWQQEDDLVPGPFDIPQPPASAPMADPDVIFTPLVAFDATLARLGQGGGYYDRVFARYPDALRIGLAWSVQQVAHVPLESWDYPLHFVLTERALIEREDAE